MHQRTGIVVTQTQRLTLSGSLHAALRILRMDAAALSRHLEEQAAETPALVLAPSLPALGDWLPRWSGLGFGYGDSQSLTDALPDQGPSLMAHVTEVLPRLIPEAARRRIGIALAEALEPTGWLGRDTRSIAADLGLPEPAVLEVLAQMQRIEPAGLFARDLAECLRLQAVEAGSLDKTMQVMLDNLPLVGRRDWQGLARLAACPLDRIRDTFARLRAFDPKPGTAFSAIACPPREPDLLARRDETGGWMVEFNRSSLPAIRVEETAEGKAAAQSLARLVESRNQTLLHVARAVLAHQRAALDHGPRALRPLTMQAIADELSLHKSTVSRVVAGTSVDTPQGSWWLRALFSPDMGAGLGAAALKARLAQLVAAEDKRLPLSDDALVEALSRQGLQVARRTVAKYRAILRIDPANRRRMVPRGS